MPPVAFRLSAKASCIWQTTPKVRACVKWMHLDALHGDLRLWFKHVKHKEAANNIVCWLCQHDIDRPQGKQIGACQFPVCDATPSRPRLTSHRQRMLTSWQGPLKYSPPGKLPVSAFILRLVVACVATGIGAGSHVPPMGTDCLWHGPSGRIDGWCRKFRQKDLSFAEAFQTSCGF